MRRGLALLGITGVPRGVSYLEYLEDRHVGVDEPLATPHGRRRLRKMSSG
jgi:hypothetical protein